MKETWNTICCQKFPTKKTLLNSWQVGNKIFSFSPCLKQTQHLRFGRVLPHGFLEMISSKTSGSIFLRFFFTKRIARSKHHDISDFSGSTPWKMEKHRERNPSKTCTLPLCFFWGGILRYRNQKDETLSNRHLKKNPIVAITSKFLFLMGFPRPTAVWKKITPPHCLLVHSSFVVGLRLSHWAKMQDFFLTLKFLHFSWGKPLVVARSLKNSHGILGKDQVQPVTNQKKMEDAVFFCDFSLHKWAWKKKKGQQKPLKNCPLGGFRMFPRTKLDLLCIQNKRVKYSTMIN